MYLKQVPKAIRSGLSSAVWTIPSEKSICLTFDDGPTEETEAILSILAEHNAKATFFLLGERIELHPEIMRQIQSEGHGIGNHGYAHLDGWKTTHDAYAHLIFIYRLASDPTDHARPLLS